MQRSLATMVLLAVVQASSAQIASAQSVHLVGPGGFADIGLAIAAAAPGDVIEVVAGTYPGFVLGKGLTIAAQPGAQVDIVAPFFANVSTQIAIPPGESARIRGLHFLSLNFLQLMPCWVNLGSVMFESCQWTAALGLTECLRVNSSRVWLRDCQLHADTQSQTNPALRVSNSAVAAVDCFFRGADLFDGANGAGHGILATNTSLQLVRCRARGGDSIGFSCLWPGGDGVRTDRGEWMWVADSDLVGGDNACGVPGSGLRNLSLLPARIARSTFVAGSGPNIAPGISGPAQTDPLIGLASASQALVRGASYRIDYQTSPGALLFVFASLDLRATSSPFVVELPWVVAPQVQFTAVLIADTGGVASFVSAVPNVPSLREAGIWAHGIDLQSAPFRIAPPVGGIVR